MNKDKALKQALEALEPLVRRAAPWGELDWLNGCKAVTAIKEYMAQPEQKRPQNCGTSYCSCIECVMESEQEFIKHHGDDEGWSEWVCPDPKGYLMKCCDCGLVHEAEFGVVRYKSETEREDCDRVDDPNLQAVFRMRRSEQWSPEDTAYRAGGMPMEQSEQKPVAWANPNDLQNFDMKVRTWVGLTQKDAIEIQSDVGDAPL